MLNKKISLVTAILLSITLVLSGCGKSESPKPSSSAPASSKQEEPKKAQDAGKEITIKLATELPDQHPTFEAMKFFAEKVKQKTNGQVTVGLFPNGQLGGSRDVIESVKMGTIDSTLVSAGPLAQFVPTVDVLSLPYIFKNTNHMHAALDGDTGKKLAEDIKKVGLVHLGWTDAGSRNIINNIRPVQKPEDMKGIKVRVMNSNLMIDTINKMGGIATPMNMGEVYSALQQKVIDGWENNSPTVLTSKLYEVSKYFSWTNHFMVPDALIFGQKALDKLSADQQKAVVEAAKETIVKQRQLWADYEGKAINELKAKGVKFNDVPDTAAFAEKVKPVWDGFTKKFGTEIVDMVQKAK